MNMEDRIYEVVIPMEDVVEFKNGKQVVVPKTVFPGYLLARIRLDDDSWFVVRNTPGVTGFVGAGNKPSPLPRRDVENFLLVKDETEDTGRKTKPRLEYEMGENVRVKEGPFADFQGQVIEINEDQLKVKVLVNIFGRETRSSWSSPRSARSEPRALAPGPRSTGAHRCVTLRPEVVGAGPAADSSVDRVRATSSRGSRSWPRSKSRRVVKIQIPAGRARRLRPSVRPRSRTAWRSWTSARTTTPAPSPSGARSCRSRSRSSRIGRSVHPQDLADLRADQEGRRDRQGRRRPAQERAGKITEAQLEEIANIRDAGPQRLRHRGREAPGRRHRPAEGWVRNRG